jgi:hypothetical protein
MTWRDNGYQQKRIGHLQYLARENWFKIMLKNDNEMVGLRTCQPNVDYSTKPGNS